jgi:hypothetical protein
VDRLHQALDIGPVGIGGQPGRAVGLELDRGDELARRVEGVARVQTLAAVEAPVGQTAVTRPERRGR